MEDESWKVIPFISIDLLGLKGILFHGVKLSWIAMNSNSSHLNYRVKFN